MYPGAEAAPALEGPVARWPWPTISPVVASTFVVNPVIVVILVVAAGLAFGRAVAFRRATGRNPWGIHPVVWLVIGLLFGLLGSLLCLIAVLTSKHRAQRTTGSGGGGDGGAGRTGPTDVPSALVVPAPPESATLPVVALPGWQPDPSGRHQHRYWSGATWTDYVSDDGVATIDPPH